MKSDSIKTLNSCDHPTGITNVTKSEPSLSAKQQTSLPCLAACARVQPATNVGENVNNSYASRLNALKLMSKIVEVYFVTELRKKVLPQDLR